MNAECTEIKAHTLSFCTVLTLLSFAQSHFHKQRDKFGKLHLQ